MREISELINKIHCCDCLDLMKEMPDKSVDLVLTDPPYGIKRFENGIGKGDRLTVKSINSDFNNLKPDKVLFDAIFRVSKQQIIFGANNFSLPETEYFIIWDKKQTVDNFASAEYAWTNIPIPAKVFRYSIHKHNSSEEKFHPTQKPLPLMMWCLEKYSKPGMTVLDPFMGSGTTCVACKKLGRNYIGIEKEPEYIKIAEKRLEKVNNHKITDFFGINEEARG